MSSHEAVKSSRKWKNLHATKSIMFSDMPSMSYFTGKHASGKVSIKRKAMWGRQTGRQTGWRNAEQLELENKLNRKPYDSTSQRPHERECRAQREEMGIYRKDLAPPLIALCIHGWLRRNTREHFSRPVGSSSIHAAHILAVGVERMMLVSLSSSTLPLLSLLLLSSSLSYK